MKIIESGKCGDNVSYELTEDGVLHIFGVGNMWDCDYKKSLFYETKYIKHVIIAYGVTSIGRGAFECFTSLKSIEIPYSVTKIGWTAFYGCISLESIEIPNSITEIGLSAFGACSLLKSIVIPNGVATIESDAFKDCTSLESIVISNSVTEIGWSAFKGCTLLKSIIIPNGVTSIGNEAFKGCTLLKLIKISNSITLIGYSAFEDCTSLESIVIPASVKYIDYSVFKGCTSLDTIVCLCEQPPFGVDGKDLFGREEYEYGVCLRTNEGCLLKVPKGSKQTYMEHKSWKHIKNIEEFELTNGECGDDVNFELQDNGTMIIFGSGEMGNDYTFENDTRIKRVVIRDGVISLNVNAFKDCRKLRIVEIESPLEEIADGAFSGCENIFSMTIASEIPPIVSEHTLEGLMRTIEIRVPANVIRYYKAAKYWNEFTNYVAID